MKSGLLILFLFVNIEASKVFNKFPSIPFEPCLGSSIVSKYEYGLYSAGEENQYHVSFIGNFSAGTSVTVGFDSEAHIYLLDQVSEYLAMLPHGNGLRMNFIENSPLMLFTVKGIADGKVPYFNSLMINGVENCRTPIVGYLDDVVKSLRISRQVKSSPTGLDCGRRKLDFSELIVNGESTLPGEWPWHAAIYIHRGTSNTYICGGTLLSKIFVLTAAHCATLKKVPIAPDTLSVVLGKYNLVEGDVFSEERQVYLVIVHDNFGSPQQLDNDIALLKLKTEAVYSDYIQPACLWSNDWRLPTSDIIGTVVGWGYSETNYNALSPKLKQASLPMISELKCIRSNPTFYGTMLKTDGKFCAGIGNGTSPCNGDSGGGLNVYVPDASTATGAWYIRGVVSTVTPYRGTTVCDPTKYVVFTDVWKYVDWIQIKTNERMSRVG